MQDDLDDAINKGVLAKTPMNVKSSKICAYQEL